MQRVKLTNGEAAASRSVHLGTLRRPYAFASPARGEYALLLVVEATAEIDPDEQSRLSEQFVRTGCRYAVCVGPDSSSWDDSIDMVGVMDEIEGRSAPFVMTTWRDREPLDQAVWDFANLARFDDWSTTEYVAVLIGGDARREEELLRVLVHHFESAS